MDLISTQLEQLLSESPREREVGEWLKGNPILVSRVVGGHSYANHVIAEFRLGTEYRADFVAAGSYSGGCNVHLVELEGPNERLFTKDGRMAKKLNEAVFQIDSWKRFVEKDRSTILKELSRSMKKKELVFGPSDIGLIDNTGKPIYHPDLWIDFTYHIIVGRRSELSNFELENKASFFSNHGIHIMTFDRVLDSARKLDDAKL